MRHSPTRFALVLTAIVAAAALAIVLTSRGSGPHNPPTIGTGVARACISTRAAAQVTARSSIMIDATTAGPGVGDRAGHRS